MVVLLACAAANGDTVETPMIIADLIVKAELAGERHHLLHQEAVVAVEIGPTPIAHAVHLALTMETVLLVNLASRI